jgi:hypothetical protein
MSKQNNHTLLGQCIAEFIGTGLLIFFGVGCVAALVLAGAQFGQWEISIVWGLAVALAVYCTAGVSGACFGRWLYPKVIGIYLPTEGVGCTIPNQCEECSIEDT